MRRLGALVVLLVVVSAAPAWAAPGSNGEPISGTPDLLATSPYGRVSNLSDQTKPASATSGYAECGTTTGAAAYKFSAPAGAIVDVDVVDDAAGQSVCAIELFARSSDAGDLASIYDVNGRAPHRVGFDECPLGNSVCHDRWTLARDDVFYLVAWPAGDNDPDFAGFTLTAAVRQPTVTSLSLSGPHVPQKSGWFLITKGARLTATATVTPAEATGPIRFWIDRFERGAYHHWSYATVATSPQAQVSIRFSLEGLYYVSAVSTGDDTHAVSVSPLRGVVVQTPTKQNTSISGYSGIDREEGYYIFRRGAYVTTLTSIVPTGATGTVTFQWFRLISPGHVKLLWTRTFPVSNSRAAIRFVPREPFHFYRIGAIYNGDQTHLRSQTLLMCIELY